MPMFNASHARTAVPRMGTHLLAKAPTALAVARAFRNVGAQTARGNSPGICRNIVAAAEVLPVERAASTPLRPRLTRMAVAKGMRVLRADGMRLIRAGLTTPEEVLRVAL
jgi:hypothetical protein